MTIGNKMPKQFKLASDLLGISTNIVNADRLEILKHLPFWDNTNYNWNRVIGLPKKNGIEMPIFEYQMDLFNKLFKEDGTAKDKHQFLVKSTGIGATELYLRIIGWLCTKDDKLKGSQIVIVTGPNIELAITLINRLKLMFYNKLGIIFSDKETVLKLNGVHIQAYPSHHLDSARGLANVSFWLSDEADFFPIGQQQDERDISERYIAKSNPYIVTCSTPNKPDSLYYHLEQEKEEDCIYHRIRLPYTVGLGKIYTKEEISRQMKSPSFEREYNLKYLGAQGNILTFEQVDAIVKIGQQVKDIAISQYTLKTIGVDFGYSSSQTSIVMLEHIKDKYDVVRVVYSELIPKGDPNEICNKLFELYRRYWNVYFYVDGSNRASVNLLKIKLDEPLTWDTKDCNPQSMKCVPINFGMQHKQMLSHLMVMVTEKNLAIPEQHDKLIISLKTAYAKELSLVKEQSSYNDLLDALRLALIPYEIQ